MPAYRRAAKVDNSQGDIVNKLRTIPGVTVEVGHDDILVGWRGKTFWYEIKTPGSEKDVQPSQIRLRNEWRGHYRIVSTLHEILRDMGLV